MDATWTEAEIKRMLWLRAIEWTVWPAFLSALLVPIFFVWNDWWKVLIGLLVADLLWCIVRYQLHNLPLANFAAVLVGWAKWPIAIACFIALILQRRYMVAVLSLLWPALSGFAGIPGMIGRAELNFAHEIGYGIIDESQSNFSG